MGLPWLFSGKKKTCFPIQETWVQSVGPKTSWRRKWQPTPILLRGKYHGQRSLMGYSPWGHKSQTQLTDWTTKNSIKMDYLTWGRIRCSSLRSISIWESFIMRIIIQQAKKIKYCRLEPSKSTQKQGGMGYHVSDTTSCSSATSKEERNLDRGFQHTQQGSERPK